MDYSPSVGFLLGHILLLIRASPDFIFSLSGMLQSCGLFFPFSESLPVGCISRFASSNVPLSWEQGYPSVGPKLA